MADAFRAAGAGDEAEAAAPAAVRDAIDALVEAHQRNVDLTGDDRLNAVLDGMSRRCPGASPTAATIERAREAVFDSPLWEPPDIIPGISAALETLDARGFRMAVVCNTGLAPGPVLERMLDERGLGRHFDTFAWSDVVCSWKPGPEIFQAALAALGIGAPEAAFIGDTPEADILGARHAGFGLVVQVGDKPVAGIEPDLHLPGVDCLPDALAACGI